MVNNKTFDRQIERAWQFYPTLSVSQFEQNIFYLLCCPKYRRLLRVLWAYYEVISSLTSSPTQCLFYISFTVYIVPATCSEYPVWKTRFVLKSIMTMRIFNDVNVIFSPFISNYWMGIGYRHNQPRKLLRSIVLLISLVW